MPRPGAGGSGGKGKGGTLGGACSRTSVGGSAANDSEEAVGGRNNPRTKLKPLEMRAKMSDRPNTVVIDGKGFSVLPSESELAHFMDEVVFKLKKASSYLLR